jgi:hypothetical protein
VKDEEMKMKLLYTIFLMLAIASSAIAEPKEISYGKEEIAVGDQMGLDNHYMHLYQQRIDITLSPLDKPENPRLLIHARVGSKIEPVPGEGECRLGLRVNGNMWHWIPLQPYQNDQDQWIEFPIPASELRAGLNRIETYAKVWFKGGGGDKSKLVFIHGGRYAGPIRSWGSGPNALVEWSPLPDFAWHIRLRFEQGAPPGGTVKTLRIVPDKAVMSLQETVQFLVEARDQDGRLVDPGPVQWSSTLGQIDSTGLFGSGLDGSAEITVKAAGLDARASCRIEVRPFIGVAPPESELRLRPNVPEGHVNLSGRWQFRRDPGGNLGESQRWFEPASPGPWGTIHVPGTWQAQGWETKGDDRNRYGWYRREVSVPEEWKGRELWLRFGGAATHAKVWVNGRLAGEHLGTWAPFELRITDFVAADKANTITVRVHENGGHFSRGFPCAVAPHFGGLWQPVSLYAAGSLHLDDVAAFPSLAAGAVKLVADVSGGGTGRWIGIVFDPAGKEVARREEALTSPAKDYAVTIPIINPQPWAPATPALYRAQIEIRIDGKLSDRRELSFGMRDVTRKGSDILLNGQPLFVRGILHWGYYPNLLNIDPSEAQIRREFADLRAAGFNLVKVCMFTFPKRFYEIADETGMLIWQEYPVWWTFPKTDGKTPLDKGPFDHIVREYGEWYRYGRSHPSVILRSLTCEASFMNQDLTRQVIELGKSLTGDALIIDNSAGGFHQTYTDFYDEHIYKELPAYHDYLPKLAKQLREIKPEVKPYLTGEDYDADTYPDLMAIRKGLFQRDEAPWWVRAPTENIVGKMEYEKALAARAAPDFAAQMVARNMKRVLSLRKNSVEDFRRFPELSGYVITTIADLPAHKCGFYDQLGQAKWTSEQWRAFTADRILALNSARASFCFRTDENASFEIAFSNFGAPLKDEPLRWRLMEGEKTLAQGEGSVSAACGEVVKAAQCEFAAGMLSLTKPKTLRLVAELGQKGETVRNEWRVWFFPAEEKELLKLATQKPVTSPEVDKILITASLDEATRKALTAGARVIYLPAEEDKSFPRKDASFWRMETAIWLPTGHPALGDFPHEDFVDRQFYDLTTYRPFDTQGFRDRITPLIWGFSIRTTGMAPPPLADYLFEARVGKGKLLACALNVRGAENVAGNYLLECLIRYANSSAFNPLQELDLRSIPVK